MQRRELVISELKKAITAERRLHFCGRQLTDALVLHRSWRARAQWPSLLPQLPGLIASLQDCAKSAALPPLAIPPHQQRATP
jgi:hypothetical protein